MPTGNIKKLMTENGYGFIQGEGGKDIFFHHLAVENQGFEALAIGQQVEFTLDQKGAEGKGPRAATVKPI